MDRADRGSDDPYFKNAAIALKENPERVLALGEYASFRSRVWAALIDILVLLIPSLLVIFLGAVLVKRDAWARIAGCMREEAGSVVGSVIV